MNSLTRFPTDEVFLLENDARKAATEAWHRAQSQISKLDEILKDYCRIPGIIGEAASYHIATGGKRFRPMFLLAVSAAINAHRHNALQLAAAVEMLHNASLVHDDLQDKDTFRRGKATVWRRYGADIAVNLGDFFISSTYSALARIAGDGGRVAKIVALFAESTRQIIAGQSEEIELTRQVSIAPDAYHRIARGKSGILMALPVVSALMIAGVDSRTIFNARNAMENLGIAYQIKDDLSDILGTKDGRAAGVDLREGRMSLPIIHFLASAGDKDHSALENIILSKTSPDVVAFETCLEKLRSSEAIGTCQREIDMTIRKADKHIELLPPVIRETIRLGMQIVTSAVVNQNRGL
jgi:geranylgeranyl pyrophosphate synthase